MKKLFKATAAAAMVGLLAFAAAGCGGGDKKAAPAAKDTLKMGVTNFADSFEPTENYFGWVVMRYGVGECLTKFDKNMNTVGWLADKWSVSDDKLTWTLHINDKATFSNGKKVTGQAAADSILRTFKMAKRAQSMFAYESIKGDGQNVIIKTKKPVVTIPGMLGDPLFIICDVEATAKRDTRKEGIIGTGPYVTESFTKAKFV
ncbi:MAG: ABC transporter substrate-binding protein, partial [Phascolarctobacterium sp.]|nr:ABC transporter substrate-binding protein [Phascolarctobacterium sp.]